MISIDDGMAVLDKGRLEVFVYQKYFGKLAEIAGEVVKSIGILPYYWYAKWDDTKPAKIGTLKLPCIGEFHPDSIDIGIKVKVYTETEYEQLAEKSDDSARQIQRYIRLTYLVPELQEFVDKGQMKMRPAVELSYLDEETQRDIVDRIDETEAFPSHDQAIRIRKAFEAGEINYDKVQNIMAEEKPNQKPKFKFSFDRLKPYIPKDYSDKMAEDYVIKALEHYQKYLKKQREQAR